MLKFIWILGAPDHEMEAIETLLKEHGQEIGHATIGEKRVRPHEAYKADSTTLGYVPEWFKLKLVECMLPNMPAGVTRIDHHNPGDAGYGKSPKEYFFASSIGQTICHLAGLGIDVPVTKGLQLIAAADHCLAHAYAGDCPGIDPLELYEFRVKEQSRFLRRPIEQIRANIENARELLKEKAIKTPRGLLADFGDTQLPKGISEASAIENIAFMATGLPFQDGRRKESIMSAPKEMVEWWMMEAKARGLEDIYGDPARGFAGGYKK